MAVAENKGFKKGDKVGFRVGKAQTYYEAVVVGFEGAFLMTSDADGNMRKVRPGSCSAVA